MGLFAVRAVFEPRWVDTTRTGGSRGYVWRSAWGVDNETEGAALQASSVNEVVFGGVALARGLRLLRYIMCLER